MSQVLIDQKILKLYCTGTDDDRKVIDKMYPGVIGSLKMDMFLAMIREYKNNPSSKWQFFHDEKKVMLDIQITVEEKPFTHGTSIENIIEKV